MVQLKVLSGKQAGASWAARRFPVRVGRASDADFRADDDGVWDQHLTIEFHPEDGFRMRSQDGALILLNDEPAQENRLRNGDILELGGLKMQFWLAEVPQRELMVRELLVWLGVAALSAAQIALIYWLPR
jgi:predicted component of type VI protein secretion system